MGTYLIPRNLKGEGRILTIFSYKALVYTAIGAGVGAIFYAILKQLKLSIVGIVIVAIFATIGFIIGTIKMPGIKKFEITRKTSGEKIDEIILRLFKFKRKRNRIYIYKGGEKESE